MWAALLDLRLWDPALGSKNSTNTLHKDVSVVSEMFAGAGLNLLASTNNNLHAAFGLVTLWSTTSQYTAEADREEEVDKLRVRKCSTGFNIFLFVQDKLLPSPSFL